MWGTTHALGKYLPQTLPPCKGQLELMIRFYTVSIFSAPLPKFPPVLWTSVTDWRVPPYHPRERTFERLTLSVIIPA